MPETPRILFVCMGNICRSPTAEGVFRTMAMAAGVAVEVDSAGTGGWHVGEAPDQRATAAAAQRGVDLSTQRARQARISDFHEFDHILAMDRDNLEDLTAIMPPDARAELRLFLDYAPDQPVREVPDPYYGGPQGFERVLDLIEAASAGLLARIVSIRPQESYLNLTASKRSEDHQE